MIFDLKRFEGFADRFLPPDPSRTPDETRRARMFIIAHVLSPLIAGLLAGMLYGLVGLNTLALLALLLGFASFYGYPFLLRMGMPLRVASNLSTGQLTILVFFTVYFFGGWTSFALPWFTALPMAGMLYIGVSGIYPTSLLALAGLTILLVVDRTGHVFANPVPAAWQMPMLMASMALCIVFNTGIALLHVRLNRLSQEQLREREKFALEVQEMAALGSWEIDYESNSMGWSDEVYRIIGVDRETFKVEMNSHLEFVHPEDRGRILQLAQDLGGGEPDDATFRLIRPDGDMRILYVEAKIIEEFPNGMPKKARGFVQDITERERTEKALRESEARLSEVRELANVGNWDLYITPDEPDQIMWSAELCRIYGIDPEDFPRDFDGYLALVHPEDRDQARQSWLQALEFDMPFGDEYRIVRPDGAIRTIVTQARIYRDTRHGSKHWIGTTTDITERKLAQEQLQQAQKMEAIGQLTGGIAHDFNNLLTVILGNLELVKERIDDTDLRKMIESGIRASDRGADLTDRLLAFSRRQALRPAALDLDSLVDGMAAMLRRTLGEMVEIRTRGTPGLWRCHADRAQLENALLNLAINARDAMTEGGVLAIETANISLDAHKAAEFGGVVPGDYVQLSVSDTGIGMDNNTLQHAFEPFFTTKEVGKGSGLGLSMVYGFSMQSGGTVTIESETGKGTTVRLFLPRALAQNDDIPLSDRQREERTKAPSA
jgi:PAS domain S-box-containing protein